MPASHQNKAQRPCDSALLGEYLDFLRIHRGLAEATIAIRAKYVTSFLAELNVIRTAEGLQSVTASRVHDYVIRTARSMTRPLRKHLVSSLRSFLRFGHVRGYTSWSLVDAVPIIYSHKLDRVPRGISWESVQKLLAAPDRTTHRGRRDYAILQMLVAYGVRIGQVTSLKAENIDWHDRLIRFPSSKKGNALCLPLTHGVAEALLAYIRQTRGNVPFPEIFLTLHGKPRPLSKNNRLNWAFELYYRQAGITKAPIGAHAIRHAFATRLMEEDVPLKTIADLLGHRSIRTTSIYTKVDLEHLRAVACEWPEVEQ